MRLGNVFPAGEYLPFHRLLIVPSLMFYPFGICVIISLGLCRVAKGGVRSGDILSRSLFSHVAVVLRVGIAGCHVSTLCFRATGWPACF